MLIIGINGSPKKKGNTAYILNKALESIKDENTEVEVIHVDDALEGLDYPFCSVCTNPCEAICYKGKPLEKVFEKLKKADGIILGSPVYFGTVSGQLKALWDLTRKLRSEKGLINTPGGVITVGKSRFGGQETTAKAIFDMMLVQGMTIVGDGYIEDDAGHQGVMAQHPSDSDENALKRAKVLAKRIKQLASNN